MQHNNILSLFLARTRKFRNRPWLYAKAGNNWQSLSWNDTEKRVNLLATYLEQLGLGSKPRIMILSENRPEWIISVYAIWAMGGIPVPVMTTCSNANIQFMMADAEISCLIVSNKILLEHAECNYLKRKLKHIIGFSGNLMHNYNNEHKDLNCRFHYFSQIVQNVNLPKIPLIERTESILPSDISAILYTSGTGGTPKGVMLTQASQLAVITGVAELFKRLPKHKLGNEVFLSFLPLSHCYEFNVITVIAMHMAAKVYFAESLEMLTKNIEQAKPTIMTAVPRLYQTIRNKVLSRLDREKGLKKMLALKTLELGIKRAKKEKLKLHEFFLNMILHILVRRKMRKAFGGRLKAFISGGAPLNPDVGAFINAMGARVLQGYGLTEASIAVSVNLPFDERVETVGPPIQGLEVKIANDGEICVKGPTVMKGYWKNDIATRASFDDMGYLKTGDIGKIVDGHLQITDRKKDIIINSGGENIAPQKIEGILQLQSEIIQAFVYGDKKPYLTAVLVINPEIQKQYKKDNHGLEQLLKKSVAKANQVLAGYEKIKKFVIAKEEFSIINEQLSPTLKIRRHEILQQYGAKLENLYKGRVE